MASSPVQKWAASKVPDMKAVEKAARNAFGQSTAAGEAKSMGRDTAKMHSDASAAHRSAASVATNAGMFARANQHEMIARGHDVDAMKLGSKAEPKAAAKPAGGGAKSAIDLARHAESLTQKQNGESGHRDAEKAHLAAASAYRAEGNRERADHHTHEAATHDRLAERIANERNDPDDMPRDDHGRFASK